MPLYELDLTVPLNTLAADPVEAELPLHPGVITGFSIQFPAGCAGMVHARILRYGSVIMPNNADNDVKGDNIVVDSEEDLDITGRPHSVIVQAWSPGTTNAHTITFRVHLRLVRVREPRFDSAALLAGLRGLPAA